jgi:hypothetical protein
MYTARVARVKAMLSEIETYNRAYILNADIEQVVEYLRGKYRFEPPIIAFDKKQIVNEGQSGHGVYVTLSIPFSGSREVLAIRPTTAQGGCPDANIGQNEFQITYNGAEARLIRAQIDHSTRAIEFNLKMAVNDLANFDSELSNTARRAFEEKRRRFQTDISIVDSLGIVRVQREAAPPTYPAPELRRQPPIATPTPDKPSEPTVDPAEYEYILGIISSMAKVMERSPRAFAHMEEEFLRDFFLVHLNGHYKGQATGETFNAGGKTDILVRARDANIFIAECKFWSGKKEYLSAIDQLLGYVTWRDTKTAIIIFNRNKNFSNILVQIPEPRRSTPNTNPKASTSPTPDFGSFSRMQMIPKRS